jgi:hypothetical protein
MKRKTSKNLPFEGNHCVSFGQTITSTTNACGCNLAGVTHKLSHHHHLHNRSQIYHSNNRYRECFSTSQECIPALQTACTYNIYIQAIKSHLPLHIKLSCTNNNAFKTGRKT